MNGPLSRTIPGHFVAHAADDGGLPGIPGSSGGPQFQGGGAQFVNPAPQSTRERDEGPFELATWGARLLAIFVDGLIMAALLVVVAVPLVLAVLGLSIDLDDETAATGAMITLLLVGFLAYLLIALLYAPMFMARWRGATPGKRMAGIRVVRADGGDLSFGDAVLREVVFKGIVVGAVGQVTAGIGFLANYLWPLWDDENRAGHDFMAKTRVVKAS